MFTAPRPTLHFSCLSNIRSPPPTWNAFAKTQELRASSSQLSEGGNTRVRAASPSEAHSPNNTSSLAGKLHLLEAMNLKAPRNEGHYTVIPDGPEKPKIHTAMSVSLFENLSDKCSEFFDRLQGPKLIVVINGHGTGNTMEVSEATSCAARGIETALQHISFNLLMPEAPRHTNVLNRALLG